ncbi:hypothetical protein I545_5413 [Mycobacterium kansasii 662]|uniref:Uncharacterized protein n=2 Tax=Mycobacterium kansasii TaxID=1768 RepID=A0A1V3WK04_MYCKA|nr:hypothetical protein I545_5413 [Mycobacterium kansasii 662]OOK63277.1 hypothetical protein BZL30_9527 [Mycobacterium kansasii]OOK67098.1 hypothetical protein BZL29_7075 [Mycobacterium kansasii]
MRAIPEWGDVVRSAQHQGVVTLSEIGWAYGIKAAVRPAASGLSVDGEANE